MAKTQIVAVPGLPQIVITREFHAPPELLYRAHTDPELLVQWLGPRTVTMTIDRLDPRDGGTWRYTPTTRLTATPTPSTASTTGPHHPTA